MKKAAAVKACWLYNYNIIASFKEVLTAFVDNVFSLRYFPEI